ncbi:MAG: hypothetical protein WC915_00035 [archaeon]|jgi:hypothetical protein
MQNKNILIIIFLILGLLVLMGCSSNITLNKNDLIQGKKIISNNNYPIFRDYIVNYNVIYKNNFDYGNQKYFEHENILATVFWVGEEENIDNNFIQNFDSAWDDNWIEHFGGVDGLENRVGYNPLGFEPKENVFYFALPYNDFDNNGKRKTNAENIVFWGNEKKWEDNESMLKNRWIRITYNGKRAYAQWEDSGPYEYDDSNYVFGTARPNNIVQEIGLDLSPGVAKYLGFGGKGVVSWRFIDFEDVPIGPWFRIITTSQIFWE